MSRRSTVDGPARRAAPRRREGRPAEWDASEAYFTPLPVVLQGLRSIATLFARPPRDVLDLCAGAGAFGQAVGSLYPDAHLVAVECRESEVVHLHRHYDQVIVGDATTVDLPPAAFVTGNTAFSLTCPLVVRALDTVRAGGLVAFLTRQTLGDAEAAEELLRRHPPLLELTISGRISMGAAAEESADQFGYQWLVWSGARPMGSPWVRRMLPRLDGASMSWTARPGTGRLLDCDDDLVVDLRDSAAAARWLDAHARGRHG